MLIIGMEETINEDYNNGYMSYCCRCSCDGSLSSLC